MRRRECRRLAPRLSAAGEGGASDLELARHLRGCGRCRRRYGQYQRLGGMVRNVDPTRLVQAVAEVRGRRRRRTRRAIGGALGGIGLAGMVAAVSSRRRRSA